EILDAEVNGHLQTVDAWVASARAGEAAGSDPLLRALHTMNGAFAMTEVPVINSVLSPAEHYARRLLAAKAVATPEGIEAVAELSDAVRSTVETLKQPAPMLQSRDALAARLGALRDSLPEAASGLAALVDAEEMGEAAAMPEAPQPHEAELTLVDMRPYGELADALPSAGSDAGGREEAVADALEAAGADAAGREAASPEAARLAAERLEAERLEAEGLEAERPDAERREAERLEAERVEAERLEAERLEDERVEAERLEAERLEAERIEAERLEAARLEAERTGGERPGAEHLDAERRRAAVRETGRAH